MEESAEIERLAGIASDSWYGKGVNAATVAYSVRVFSRHWRAGSCLELGPAEGIATAELVKRFADLTCVYGAQSFCEALKKFLLPPARSPSTTGPHATGRLSEGIQVSGVPGQQFRSEFNAFDEEPRLGLKDGRSFRQAIRYSALDVLTEAEPL